MLTRPYRRRLPMKPAAVYVPLAPRAARAACAAACGVALGLLLASAPLPLLAALSCVAMGAICVAMRRAEAAGEREDATQPDTSSEAQEAPESGSQSDEDDDDDASPRVRFRLMPPPALRAAAAAPFAFDGAVYWPRGDGQVVLAVAPDMASESLLSLCAAWLHVRPESLSVQGPRLTLTPGAPRRTVADAGLGESLRPGPAAGPATPLPQAAPPAMTWQGDDMVPGHPVFSLPWCCICLEAATGAVWSCRGTQQQHSCCDACARRYAATRLALHPADAAGTAAVLRCPAPGCPHTLLAAHELYRLVNTEELRAAHAQRVKDQADRLRRVITGQEGTELAQMLRRGDAKPCPTCHALIEKDGGCNHMFCSACGRSFEWRTMW